MSPLAIFIVPLLCITLVLGGLAYYVRVFPHRMFVLLLCLPAAVSVGLLFAFERVWPIITLDGTIVLLALIDLYTLPQRRLFSAERTALRVASLAKPHVVTLSILYHGTRARRLHVRDDVPQEMQAQPAEFVLNAPPGSRSVMEYKLFAQRRGAFTLANVYLRVPSRWGLWQRYLTYPVETALHVYPDLQQISQYTLLARTNRLSLLGVRSTRRIGQDNEFERLRDYTGDDNYKHLDWRSTARRGKLTVRDFQANQSQRLIFLLDCGRMMTNVAGGISLLDHALNAMLMLSYVALIRGDSVGLLAFSDEIHSYVPPRSGARHMNRLLHASFDRFPRLVESRYDRAFLYLASQCRKRSLVILVTNVIDDVNSHQLEQYLGNLVGRHLPLGVLLRDHRMFDFAEQPATDGPELFRSAAAAETLLWRQQVLNDLHSRGVLSLDVFPENLTAPLINQYLEIKARHLL